MTFFIALLGFLLTPCFTSGVLSDKIFICLCILCASSEKITKPSTCIQWIVLSILGWCVIGSFTSPYAPMSVLGFYLRTEGLITWTMIIYMAFLFANTVKNNKWLSYTLLCLNGAALLFSHWHAFSSYHFELNYLTINALAGFAAVSLVFIFSQNILGAACLFPLILMTGNRTAIIGCFVGIIAYLILNKGYTKDLAIISGCTIVLFCLIIAFTPTGGRFKSFNVHSMGAGSRSHWIVQASELAHSLPLFGFGLDTQSQYLKNGAGFYAQKNVYADRVHYLPLDIILQIGWIGYFACLAIAAIAIWFYFKKPLPQNILGLSVLITWITINCFNPTGILAHLIMLITLFGMKKDEIV